MSSDGHLFIDNRSSKHGYWLNGRRCGSYGTKQEAARAFVKAYLEHNPKYKPLAVGKTWRQLFAMLHVAV